MKTQLMRGLLGGLLLIFTVSSHAALFARISGQAVYDDDRNITWIADANLANTSTFGVAGIGANGTMDFATANQWIAGMNAANYLGYHDWRLPATAQPDSSCASQDAGIGYGYNCNGSEYGHLFYTEWAGTQGTVGPGTAAIGNIQNFKLFSNVQRNSTPSTYWSGTSFNASNAWTFDFSNAEQRLGSKASLTINAWAVRDGDVSPVPVPPALWLFGSGLLGLVGIAKKKKTA